MDQISICESLPKQNKIEKLLFLKRLIMGNEKSIKYDDNEKDRDRNEIRHHKRLQNLD